MPKEVDARLRYGSIIHTRDWTTLEDDNEEI